jgi:hypothetical protein
MTPSWSWHSRTRTTRLLNWTVKSVVGIGLDCLVFVSLVACSVGERQRAAPLAEASIETGIKVHTIGDVDYKAGSGGCGVSVG